MKRSSFRNTYIKIDIFPRGQNPYVEHGVIGGILCLNFWEWEGHYTHVGVGEALHLNSRHKIHPITLFLFPPILWLKNVAKICNNIEKWVELKILKKEKFLNICQIFSQKRTKFVQKNKKTGDLGLLTELYRERCSGNECGWMKNVRRS